MKRYDFKEDTLLQNRLLTKSATPDEDLALETWVASDKNNRLFWENLDALFNDEEAALVASQLNMEAAWNAVEKRISENKKVSHHSSLFKMNRAVTQWSIAATVVGVLLSTFIYLSLTKEDTSNLLATNLDVKEVILADGSTVTINSNSQLSYPNSFKDNNREVTLNGEAFFEITKNPQKPFIVKTKNLEIKVLGTKFNVDDFGGNSKLMQVNVVEGKVEVRSNSFQNNVITLVKGESAILDKEHGTFLKSTKSATNGAAWKTKTFTFNNSNLDEVLNSLSKAYKMKMAIKDSSLLNNHLTATFEKKDINFVMTIISSTFNLNYAIENETITIDSTKDK